MILYLYIYVPLYEGINKSYVFYVQIVVKIDQKDKFFITHNAC